MLWAAEYLKTARALPLPGFVVDQPKGSYRSFASAGKNYPLKGVTYPTDYGYLPGHVAQDDAELDVFHGSADDGRHGSFDVYRPDIRGKVETKFFVNLTPEEHDAVIDAFRPVLRGDRLLSSARVMPEMAKFKVGGEETKALPKFPEEM